VVPFVVGMSWLLVDRRAGEGWGHGSFC
jgi:hypothetical protein